MRWYAELLILAALVAWVSFRPDGRPKFEGLLFFNLLMEACMLIADRLHQGGTVANIGYANYLGDIPLVALALIEAAQLQDRAHLHILCWWVSLSMACAWIRFFPYTGTAVLIINAGAYVAWIGLKGYRGLR